MEKRSSRWKMLCKIVSKILKIFYSKNGDYFKGEFSKGKVTGNGNMIYSKKHTKYIEYNGAWLRGKFHGIGRLS